MGRFGAVFGLGVHARGDLVLRRGDLRRDLRVRLGADLAPRAHRLRRCRRADGHDRLADGDRGQRLDEPPDRLHRRAGVVTAHPWQALFGNRFFWHELVHMYVAAYMVVGLRASRPCTRGRGCAGAPAATSARRCDLALTRGGGAGADRGRRLGRARGGQSPAGQAGSVRRAWHDRARGPDAHRRLVRRTARCATASRCRGCSRCSRSTIRTRPSPASTPSRRTGAAGQRRPHRVPDDGRDRDAAGAAGRLLPGRAVASRPTAGDALVRPRRAAGGAALGRGADRAAG